MNVPYTPNFYDTYSAESQRSADAVVPIALQFSNARSVVDVGCGIGTWLQAFHRLGIDDIAGFDGDYVNREQLLIAKDLFSPRDFTRPLLSNRRYDLAMSVEVAEHLPEKHAAQFVASLCGLAPMVMFSGAAPYQGGDDHINEQWPEYWVEKFNDHGYVVFDCIRPAIWNNPDVAYYYAQNILLFVCRETVPNYPALSNLQPATEPLARIHPRRWLEANDPTRQRLPPLLRALPHSISRAVRLRMKRAIGSSTH
jgi:SAM-dependent methyltransferase